MGRRQAVSFAPDDVFNAIGPWLPVSQATTSWPPYRCPLFYWLLFRWPA